jgi:hypothetical protein
MGGIRRKGRLGSIENGEPDYLAPPAAHFSIEPREYKKGKLPMGMIKRTISFIDIDGNPVEEDWYFSLDEADAAETDIAHRKDLAEYLASIQKNKDTKELLDVWRQLLFAAVGKREGKLLIKGPEIVREFRFGGAYKQFFSQIIEMDDAGFEFFNSIMPEKIQKQVQEEQNKTYSKDELLSMSNEEFDRVVGTDESKMSREHLLIAFQRRNSKAA